MATTQERTINGYAIGKTLGTGMSAKVKLATRLSTGEQVALKLINRSELGARQREMLEREINAMQMLDHPNILNLQDFVPEAQYPRKNGGFRDVVMLALELGNGGELFDYLIHTGAFSEVVARTYFRQLLSALEVCHARGIFHRDLKPENLLLDAQFQLKLADFGLAAVSVDENLCVTECGTRSYMAPEVMSRRPYDGAKADIWSAGVVLFIMLAGNPPFAQAAGNDWWFNAVRQGRYDRFWAAHLRTAKDFPKMAQEFLNNIFVASPENRATIDELWEHPWMQGAVLQPTELAEAMAAKNRLVVAKKERELRAAKAQKARETAKRGDHYNPFARSANRADDQPPPTMDENDAQKFTFFYTHEDPGTVMSTLTSVLTKMGAADLKTNVAEYKMKGTIRREQGAMQVMARLYTAPQDPDLFTIVFERRSGDHLDFLKFVSTEIAQELKDVIADPAAAEAEESAAQKESEAPISEVASEDVF